MSVFKITDAKLVSISVETVPEHITDDEARAAGVHVFRPRERKVMKEMKVPAAVREAMWEEAERLQRLDRLARIIGQVVENVVPEPPTYGTTAGDLRASTDRQMKLARQRVAKRFGLTEEEAVQVISERDRFGGMGHVAASHKIIKENPRRGNVY